MIKETATFTLLKIPLISLDAGTNSRFELTLRKRSIITGKRNAGINGIDLQQRLQRTTDCH
jgi:hypothetical protein